MEKKIGEHIYYYKDNLLQKQVGLFLMGIGIGMIIGILIMKGGI